MNFKNAFLFTGLLVVSLQVTQGEAISNNLEAPTDYTEEASGDSWLTASFGTGAASYKLTDVTLLMLSDFNIGTAQVGLYSDVEGEPGTLLSTLRSPASYSTTLANTIFTDSGYGLSANSTYWIVLQSVSGSFQWAFTDDNTGSGVGFRAAWGSSENVGATWFTSALQPMQMRVDASAVPEPSSIVLLGLGLLAFFARGLLASKSNLLRADRAGNSSALR
ncbi:MAG TPA: choice-of-anchor R domain-containing protein [Edaphobacter sp.]|nr:choice-of-anchor R domain-containing protein [Edaphobacter sp.]